ncbi:hypothetical protein C1645_827760 [Glomus cerebriforme]|uniref:Uncharacterized protein n=1 Tax=Glomus cerebriforme TaxID=658196 RepID=A0A397SMV0_9GLOM|nr:hypothetical protein C1645_827760 [Glomus cerebriforme]
MDDIEKQQQQQQTTKKPTPEVENVRLTKIMKKYKYLKQWANRYLLMILIISVAAIIIGVGIILSSDNINFDYFDSLSSNNKSDSNNSLSKTNNPSSKTNDSNQLPGKILASMTGLLTSGTLLSTLLSTIKRKTNKDKNDVFFVVKKFEKPNKDEGSLKKFYYNDVFFDENNDNELKENEKRNKDLFFVKDNDNEVKEFNMKKIEKRNKKLQSMRNKYRVIFIVGALLLIIYTIIIINAIVNERNMENHIENNIGYGPIENHMQDWRPEICHIFADCFEFLETRDLTIGYFKIVCNNNNSDITDITTAATTDKLTHCKNIFGCNEMTKIIDLLEIYNSSIASVNLNETSQNVHDYFTNCYDDYFSDYLLNYPGYNSYELAFIIILVGFCGVIHYLCIISIFYIPRGLRLGLKSVFIPIILLNLFIMGLMPGCCCRKVDDYDEIQCCINIRVSRIVFTNDEEDCLNDLKRKRKSETVDIEIKRE